jgi:hypothetical protein
MIRNEAYNFFVNPGMKEKLAGKLIDEVSRPILPKYTHGLTKNYKLYFSIAVIPAVACVACILDNCDPRCRIYPR